MKKKLSAKIQKIRKLTQRLDHMVPDITSKTKGK